MPTTELLVPPVIDDSKPVSPQIGSRAVQPTPPRKGFLATSKRRKWLLAASVVVLAIGAAFYFRGSAQPAYITAVIDRGDIEAAITSTGATPPGALV